MSGDALISRRELAAVAVALLLPIPLLVAGGLRFPLSDAIGRGAASLEPGGGFGAAVVEAAPARTDAAPAVPSPVVSGEIVSAVAPLTSSVVLPPSADASSAERETPGETTPAEEDAPAPPSPPEPHTDGEAHSGEADGDSGGGISISLSEAPAAVAAESIEIKAEPADASIQVTVSEGGVAVDTGGAADLGPPLEPPAAPPTLPLP